MAGNDDEAGPLPPEERLGWAVAGLGDFATGWILPALGRSRRSRLAGLVSGERGKAETLARRWGVPEAGVRTYDDFDGIADDPTIDVVYVATPNASHRDMVERAFAAGKHVMVEKPMATTPEDCEAMIAAAERADRRLMVAYRAHFEPVNLRLAAMIEAGDLGPVVHLTSDHHRPLDAGDPKDAWRMDGEEAGGGSFPDIGIYGLNGAIWFMGEAPEALSARFWSPPGDDRFGEVAALTSVHLRFPSGRLAALSSSYLATSKRFQVFGSEAVAHLDPGTEYRENRLVVQRAGGREEVALEEPSEAQFEGEIDHLSRAIRDGGAIRTPGAMGLRDVRLIGAVQRSAREEGAWLRLDPEGRVLGGA